MEWIYKRTLSLFINGSASPQVLPKAADVSRAWSKNDSQSGKDLKATVEHDVILSGMDF